MFLDKSSTNGDSVVSVGQRRKQRAKKLLIFSNDTLENSSNILHTLHSIKEKASDASYWVFTPHQLQTLNTKLNILLGHDRHDIDLRLYSIYGIKVKKADNLQNRKSWQLLKVNADLSITPTRQYKYCKTK